MFKIILIDMRANAYRISLMTLVLGSMALSLFFMYKFITVSSDQAPRILTILSTLVLLVLQIFEVISLARGFKKERFIIHDLVYEGKDINKFPLIMDNIFLVIGLTFIILFSIFTYTLPKWTLVHYFFIEVGVYLTINCIYYDLYILIYKLDQKDQLRLIGR